MAAKSWAREVDKVFHTSPRDGNSRNSVWMERRNLEEEFEKHVDLSSTHLCLDGPSGSGKSSLAVTVLNKLEIPHRCIQITKSMTWPDLCLSIAKSTLQGTQKPSRKYRVGLEHGLPTAMFELAFGERDFNVSHREIKQVFKESFSEDTICELLVSNDEALVIDDFEKARPSVVERVSSMCKLMTQTFTGDRSKLIIIGTDDVYRRLTHNDKSLEDRIIEISVGSFDSKNESWAFICKGFDALKIHHPVTYEREGHIPREDLKKCAESVYLAADGLPKSLNVLGREIALKARIDRPRISVHDVLDVSDRTVRKHYLRFAAQYPEIIEASKTAATGEILRFMYQEGVGRIHRVEEINLALGDTYSESELRNSLGELVSVKFIVQTGFYGDVFFVENPVLAHTLAVVASFPQRYRLKPSVEEGVSQLNLPLYAEQFPIKRR